MESPSTFRVGSSFCSCNPGRRCQPCLCTWWPCVPRDTQSSALLSSLEGWPEFKPSWQPPIFILLLKTPVQPLQPKAFILRGILLPSRSSQLVISQQSWTRGVENPPVCPAFWECKLRGAAAMFPDNPKCKAIPVRKSEPWLPTQSLAYKYLCLAFSHPRAVNM